MLKATVTPDRIYQDEIAIRLVFVITLNGNPVDEPYADFVLVTDEGEFELTPTDNDGEFEYTTETGDFTTGGDPTKRISCYIRMDNDDTYGDELWLTDEFPIYAILAPSENL